MLSDEMKAERVRISRELWRILKKKVSPDLAPSDFHLFPKLKEHLKGQHFSCDEEAKSAVKKWFQKQNTNFFKDGF